MDGEFLQKYRQRRDRKKELWEKERGYLSVSGCLCVCWSVGASDRKASRGAHTKHFFYLKWRHSSLCPLWQSMDNTNLRYIKSKSLKSLTVAALLQLFKSSTSLTPCSHTSSQQLSPSFSWLLKITFKIIESLNRLFKLDRAYGSASLHMPLATMH